MLKIWGRNTSSNVQKVMWAIGEMKLPHERIDVGGPFGKTKDPFYLAMNPNSLVPTLEEEDGYILWESNSILRYLAAKHKSTLLEPADLRIRANAHKWMDWQLSVLGPAMHGTFWGLVRTPPEKRNHAEIADSKERTAKAAAMLDAQLAKTKYLASDDFSYGDIPAAIQIYRYVSLVPERPKMANLDRWYAALSSRPAFKQHVGDIPLV
jgi:glutathione S-transferase